MDVAQEAFGAPWGAPAIQTMDEQALARERELLNTAIVEELREIGKADFWSFITMVVYPETWELHYTEEFHKPIADELQNLKCGEDFWAFLPRKRRKTMIATILFSLWSIVRDPNIRILLVGAREETVKPFAMMLRSAFVPGTSGFETFQKVYPEHLLKHGGLRQAFQFTVPSREKTLADPTFRATYLGVTGAGWRADRIHFDDCIERRNVTSPATANKSMTQMLDLIPLLDDTGNYQNVVGLGTRYSYLDPYGKVLGEAEEGEDQDVQVIERLQERKTKIMVRHALEKPGQPCEACPKHVVELYPHNHPTLDEDGVSPDYPVHTRDHVMEDYRRYMTNPNLGEALFMHQLQNLTVAPSERRFQPEWFLDLDKPSWPVAKRRVLVVDSADKDFQQAGSGDWMVAWMGDFDDYGRLCLRHGLRNNRWTREEFLRRIITWCQGTGWWPNMVAKEKFGEDTFLSDVRRVFLGENRPVHCVAVTRPKIGQNQLSKFDWIVSCLQAPMERGEIVFGSKVPPDLRRRVEYELTNLGQVAHDDCADGLAVFFSPAVRLNAPQRHASPPQIWQPPAMTTYQPDRAPSPPPMDAAPPTAMDQLQSGGTMVIASPDLGWSTEGATWNPPPMQTKSGLQFSPYQGSGPYVATPTKKGG